MTSKKNSIVALMTIRKTDGTIITVEVHNTAGHHDFYHWFIKKQGTRRKPTRVSDRNDGQVRYDRPHGLEVLALRFQGAKVKITVRSKRLYRWMVTCSATDLPGYRKVSARITPQTDRPWNVHHKNYGKRGTGLPAFDPSIWKREETHVTHS